MSAEYREWEEVVEKLIKPHRISIEDVPAVITAEQAALHIVKRTIDHS